MDELISFGDFRLDPVSRQLRHRGTERPLRAKSFAVLHYLARHPGRLVKHDELLRAVWPNTAVSPTVLRVCVREIRNALGSDGQDLLRTVPRRGYHFAPPGGERRAIFVGRREELATLHQALAAARSGQRQIVFVGGEMGAGKTSLLNKFLDEVRAAGPMRVARGQCLDLHGGREAYGPILDMLNRACGEADGGEMVDVLARRAPSWLLQLSAHVDDALLASARQRAAGAKSERMLRELSEALEQMTRDRPLLIALDDLHWGDTSTVDALSALAQRSGPAQLLVVVTFRPNEPHDEDQHLNHLVERLCARSLCPSLMLGRLSADEVAEYLRLRLAAPAIDAAVAAAVHRCCAGYPLYMVVLVDHVLARGLLCSDERGWHLSGPLDGVIPVGVSRIVASALSAQADEVRTILAAASVVGTTFTVASVVAATGLTTETVGAVCERLADRRRLLRRGVESWPDGTLSERYEFGHALYGQVIYEALSSSERSRLHRSVAARLAAAYGERGGEMAARLARHYEIGGDVESAIRCNIAAAKEARRRMAPPEIIAHLRRAIALLGSLPADEPRLREEVKRLLELASTMIEARGYGDPDLGATLQRASDAARQIDATGLEILAVAGLCSHRFLHGEIVAAQRDAERLVALSQHVGNSLFTVLGYATLGGVLFTRGALDAAQAALERADAAWDPAAAHLPVDECIMARGVLAMLLRVRGRHRDAVTALQRTLARAEEVRHQPFNVAQANTIAAQVHALGGDREAALRHAEVALAVSEERGFPDHRATSLILKGWAEGDCATLRLGLDLHARHHHRLAFTLFAALHAETLLGDGDAAAALAALDEALAFASSSDETRHLAELHRLRAHCLLRRSADDADSALAELQRAVAVARRQKAALFEERARGDIARLGREPGAEIAAPR